MILVFGGTTEGRAAVEVLDEAGKPFYYSTRGNGQSVHAVHGERVTGGMDALAMESFCKMHGIRLLVDAGHPFATELHHNVVKVAERLAIPAVRYERVYPERNPAWVWCDSYADAVARLQEQKVVRLLALTGAQTISALRAWWANGETWFRVLDRPESRKIAAEAGFPLERLMYFRPGEDSRLLEMLRPDAILTKESGESGYFEEKTAAATRMGIPVFVVKRPPLPEGFCTVSGKHGLRYRVERLLPGFFPLRSGYTTGTCACAAAKAALSVLLSGQEVTEVSVALPCGEEVALPVAFVSRSENSVACSVVKDAGDDPDITNGREIRADVAWDSLPGVHFHAGEGVGTVTLPGLGLAVGEPAINPVPRRMMIAETGKLLRRAGVDRGVSITIAVPGGKELAVKTFNPKLGIVGGISILGTSGIVRPFSAEALVETIHKEIQVAKALGCTHLVINSGAKSERLLRQRFPDLLPQAFIHYGNYIGETLCLAAGEGIGQVTMGIMIGKAVKLAEGHADTHSRHVVMNPAFLAALAHESGCPDELCVRISRLALARELWTLLPAEHPFFQLLVRKCETICRRFFPQGKLELLLLPEMS